jgi:pilus assembly protein Flp/PilA
MRPLLSRFLHDQSGVTAIEYCLIAAGVGMMIISAVNGLGSQLTTTLTSVGTAIK